MAILNFKLNQDMTPNSSRYEGDGDSDGFCDGDDGDAIGQCHFLLCVLASTFFLSLFLFFSHSLFFRNC